jgi:catalase
MPLNHQRDGLMRVDDNGGGRPNYWPNSFSEIQPEGKNEEPDIPLSGAGSRYEFAHRNDDFVQAGNLYRHVMTEADRDSLITNIVGHMKEVPLRIQLRQCAIFYLADAEYGERVSQGLGLDMNLVQRLAGMSQEQRVSETADM